MTSTRFLETATAQTSASAVEFIAPQADQYENPIYQTDVH
jgi:hypothetical protein